MARALAPLPTELSLLRICSQGLIAATACDTVIEVVARMLAVQGQQVSALPHALIARAPDTVGSDVAEAFAEGRLVRHRPMRGTVHITTAEDFHWMRAALKAGFSSWERRNYEAAGIDDAAAESACAVAWQAIADAGGHLPRAELFRAWLDSVDNSHARTDAERRRWCQLLMYRTAHMGAVIEGPMGRNQHSFIDARTLPAADAPDSGFRINAEQRLEGQIEIARRYIHGHGPVTIDDLAWWTGLNKTTAARLLDSAVDTDAALSCYRLDDGGLVPAEPAMTAQQRRALVYMRSDLPDLLAAHRAEAEGLLFLPSFDELYVGYANRTCLTDTAGDELICPTRNGMFRPLLIDKGRLVGVRPVSEGVLWLGRAGRGRARAAERLVTSTFERLGQ